MSQSTEKRCIMHVPNYIDRQGRSGSSIRPLKMKQAFEANGYEVEFISGYGRERKQKIDQLKKKIQSGIKYDFLYSESSTMPTLLTEKNHLPRYPLLDFSFFRFCREHKIKTGLFYRDIQWKFPLYTDHVPWYKKCLSIPCYKYDLHMYRKYVDILYLPTLKMADYLSPDTELVRRVKVLMPGCDEMDNQLSSAVPDRSDETLLTVLYVGGIDKIYDLTVFFRAVSTMRDKVKAYVCCRKNEWESAKHLYTPYLTDNITIIHESGKGLEPYYKKADLCCAFAGRGEYMQMAMPVKIFEYLGHRIPILATEGTVSGDFVEKEGIGWSIGYSEEKLKECIEDIVRSPDILKEKQERENAICRENTWKARAYQVIQDLK